MKKLITVLLSLVLCFSFTACTPAENNNDSINNDSALGENAGGDNINDPVELTQEEKILIYQEGFRITAQNMLSGKCEYQKEHSSHLDSEISEQALLKVHNYIVEQCVEKMNDAETQTDLISISANGQNQLRSLYSFFFSYDWIKGHAGFIWDYVSDYEGIEYTISRNRNFGMHQVCEGYLSVKTEDPSISFKIISTRNTFTKNESGNEDVQFITVIDGEGGCYLVGSPVIEDGDYVGVIVYKDGRIVGYTSLMNDNLKDKSVNFDLFEGQEVTEEQVIELMKLAYKGIDGEAECGLKVLPNKRTLPMRYNGEYGAVPENWRYIEDNPSILYESEYTWDSKIGAEDKELETEYEVWSDVAFTYNGEEVKSAKVKGGERIYFTDKSGESANVCAIKYVEGEIVGISVVKVFAEQDSSYDGVLLRVLPINWVIEMVNENSWYVSIPKELALAYIDYFAGQDVPEIRV